MSEVRIAAEPRTEFGKGAARRVRRAHRVPVVLYGHGDAPRHYSLPGHELMLALKHDANTLLTLQTEDGDQLALPKAVVRDPLKGFLEHVDLVAVRRGERVTVEVPVQLTGEAGADTLVDQQTLTLTVSADATALPDHLELDITGRTAGDSLAAADVALPSGTELGQDPEHVMVAFLGVVSEEQLEAELAESEAELGAGAAGAQAAADDVEVGSESDATGEGDVVGETEAPQSETPAQ
ncbi:MAG: LSU ribosomal protein L25p [uncultured Frankineae bacterium]|uniref:Large ribosomal subunit protein bL25 n=1 Tax=uncultured Frankineae bacterium TaxID=437475 RepID=A0A6J4LRZ4_9ACTN|nr:MAG: LSU ribosomal protein L25p [uncultured Frankineae bacterium]